MIIYSYTYNKTKNINNVVLALQHASKRVTIAMRTFITISSTVAEGSRFELCQLKSCQLQHNYTKNRISKAYSTKNHLEGHRRSSEVTRFDRPYVIPISGPHSNSITLYFAPFPRYYNFSLSVYMTACDLIYHVRFPIHV